MTERSGPPPRESRAVVEVRADLDVPGETGRQARIFALWVGCLALALLVGSLLGAHVPSSMEGTEWAAREMARSRAARAKVAVVLALLLPAAATWLLNRRYRRGGAHARGIVVDVTDQGELRIWGRGYGVRVELAGAAVTERLVDVYAGRLGAWRQRRMRLRGASAAALGGSVAIELATTAIASDPGEGLRVEGGEGDCVELGREDYGRIRDAVLERALAARTPR